MKNEAAVNTSVTGSPSSRMESNAPMQALLRRGAFAFVAHQHHRADTYSGTEIKEGRDHRGRNHLQHHLRYGRADGIEGGGENGQKDGHALAFLVQGFLQ